MLEDVLTNTSFSPALIGAVGAAALIFFVIGRLSAAGNKKREESLKREVLDAKASVPQLESSVRNRDTQIARLQEEIGDLNDRTNDLLRDQDKQANALRSAEREVKNLTSELNAVRGVRSAEDNLVMDGFEDEVAAEPGDSAIAPATSGRQGPRDRSMPRPTTSLQTPAGSPSTRTCPRAAAPRTS